MKVFSRKNALLLAALLIALAAACAFALSRAQTAVMLVIRNNRLIHQK